MKASSKNLPALDHLGCCRGARDGLLFASGPSYGIYLDLFSLQLLLSGGVLDLKLNHVALVINPHGPELIQDVLPQQTVKWESCAQRGQGRGERSGGFS